VASDDITYIQIVPGDTASARPRTGLSEAQKTGQACIVCGFPGAPEHLGYVNGISVKIHTQCAGRWRHGDGPPHHR